MKKLIGLTLCIMFVVLTFASSVYATTYNYESFTVGAGYGEKTKVDDNITKLTGGAGVGPYSKASSAKLADGIIEKVYVEVDPEELAHGELFEISLALKNGANEYVSEAVVMSQKNDGEGVVLTAGWAPEFRAIITEKDVYTYKWEMFIENGTTFVKFTVLKGETVVETTGNIDFDTIVTGDTKNPIAEQENVSVKYLWFCNIQVANGINVYAELPKTEEQQPADEVPAEVPTAEVPAAEVPADKKDETPKTGSIDMVVYAGVVIAVISSAVIVAVKKYNK